MFYKNKSMALTAVALAIVTSNSVAQTVLEEVVVTATRKAESAQDVGIAISAFTGDTLNDLGVKQPIDIAAQTPGLFIKNGIGSANPYISIRNVGQSLFVSNASQPVGTYVNDVNLSYTSLTSAPIYDVSRVEVLKGPQGTLFGRNSTAGALSIFSNKPSDETDGSFTLGLGNNNLFEAEGFINGALSDSLAGRVAFKTRQQDGFFTNNLTGNDLGHADVSSGRVSLEWDVNDSFVANLVLEATRDRSGNTPWSSFGFADPTNPVTSDDLVAAGLAQGDGVDFSNGNEFGRNEVYGAGAFAAGFLGSDRCSEDNSLDELIALNQAGVCTTATGQSGDADLYSGEYSLEPDLINDTYSATLNLQYQFGDISLTSISAYLNSERLLGEEFDGTSAISADNIYGTDIELFSQEIRLAGGSDRVDWVGGVYYSYDEVDETTRTNHSDVWFFTHLIDFTQTTDNLGVFGHANWRLNDSFDLITDLRYTSETIEYDGGISVVDVIDPDFDAIGRGLPVTAGFVATAPAGQDETDLDEVTWKLGLEYTPNDDWLWYAFASRGVKSGGYNGFWVVLDDELAPYDSESLISYELGFKSTLLNSTLQFNGGVFLYDYEDLQSFVLDSDFLFVIDNIPETEIKGAEFDINWLATDNLEVRAGVSFNDTEITKVTPDQINNGILVGNRTANSAEFMFNGLVKYSWAVNDRLEASVQTDFNYQSETFFTVQNTRAASQDDLWLANARATLGSANDERWEVALWVKNIADEDYVTEAFPDPGEALIAYNPSVPRTYGVTYTYNF